jgi:hypothetical protein
MLNYATPGRLGELSAPAERLNFVLAIDDLAAGWGFRGGDHQKLPAPFRRAKFTALCQSTYDAMRTFRTLILLRREFPEDYGYLNHFVRR